MAMGDLFLFPFVQKDFCESVTIWAQAILTSVIVASQALTETRSVLMMQISMKTCKPWIATLFTTRRMLVSSPRPGPMTPDRTAWAPAPNAKPGFAMFVRATPVSAREDMSCVQGAAGKC